VRRLAAVCLLVLLPGCATAATDREHEVTVFAAASLAPAFGEIAAAFEAANPDAGVRLHVAGSRTLVAQLREGARADVLATADAATMGAAAAAGVIDGAPVAFATNAAAVAVPVDNPARVRTLADLSEPGMQVVVCAVPVPCGVAARELLAGLGREVRPVSEETSVAGVVGKVAAGEADAGIMYATDVVGQAAVRSVPLPPGVAVSTTYPIAPVAGSAAVAQRFIDYVLSPDGQGALAEAGFGPP
jgi:molybdate transport system substrate-binding protein